MDNVLLYIFFTAALALQQVWDNYRILGTGGTPVHTDWAFSLLEFCWVFASILVLYHAQLNVYELLIPVAYLLYNVYGWIIGYCYMRGRDVRRIQVIRIPPIYLWFSLFFSLSLFVYSAGVLYSSYPSRNAVPIHVYLSNFIPAIVSIVLTGVIARSIFIRIYRLAEKSYEGQVLEAISENGQCAEFFGEISKIIEHKKITNNLGADEFAYFVIGSKNRGLVVAEFVTTSAEEEKLVNGFISTDEGEIIELEENSFRA